MTVFSRRRVLGALAAAGGVEALEGQGVGPGGDERAVAVLLTQLLVRLSDAPGR